MTSNQLNTWRNPPVESIPFRPLCPQCHKPLRVQLRYDNDMTLWDSIEYIKKLKKAQKRGNISEWRYDSRGHFCTKNCATAYANRVIDKKGHIL